MAISGTYTAGDAVSFGDCLVEVELTGADSAWADIDSWATEVSVNPGTVPIQDTYPFEGGAITFTGSRGSDEVTVTVVYTEGSTDPFQNIFDRFAASSGPDFGVRWVPASSASGNFRFEITTGKLIGCTLPQGGGDAATATVFTFTVQGTVVRDAIT
jgi:hypothetical protein